MSSEHSGVLQRLLSVLAIQGLHLPEGKTANRKHMNMITTERRGRGVHNPYFYSRRPVMESKPEIFLSSSRQTLG